MSCGPTSGGRERTPVPKPLKKTCSLSSYGEKETGVQCLCSSLWCCALAMSQITRDGPERWMFLTQSKLILPLRRTYGRLGRGPVMFVVPKAPKRTTTPTRIPQILPLRCMHGRLERASTAMFAVLKATKRSKNPTRIAQQGSLRFCL